MQNKLEIHPIMENETHELLLDFEIHTDHLISARRPDFIIINKKERTWRIVDFAVPVDHWLKLKEWEKYKYLNPCKGILKKYGTWRWQ